MRLLRSKSRHVAGLLLPVLLVAGSFRPREVSGGEKVFFEGHYYERVDHQGGITWYDAVADASRRIHRGLPGHLVTVTSAAEAEFLKDELLKGRPGRYPQTFKAWIGGFQPLGSPEPAGNWKWITDEEFDFTNWSVFEPDNAFGDENALSAQGPSLADQGKWSDLNAGERLTAYIIEYESPDIEGSLSTKPSWRDSALDPPQPGGDMQAVRDRLGRIYLPLGSDPADGSPRKGVIRFDETTRDWQYVADLTIARRDAAVAIDHLDRVYCIGGLGEDGPSNTVERYDPRADEWTSVAPLPQPRWAARAMATADGGMIYVMGGRLGLGGAATPTVSRYSVESDVWLFVPPMSVPRVWFGAALDTDGLIYAVGGSAGLNAGETGSTAERLHPPTNRWSPVASLRFHDFEVGAAVGDACGFIYALGGFDRGFSRAVERYLPGADRWEPCPPLRVARRRFAAALSPSGRIYAFGGEGVEDVVPGVEYTFSCKPITVTRVWKVSVKFLLDREGNRPAGTVMTEDDVRAQIDTANQILCSSGSEYTLELVEVRDVPNASRWLVMDCVDDHLALQSAARANPGRFQWRGDAINVYVGRELLDCGGVCSFPDTEGRIIVLSQRTTPTTLLHEIGHYFGLCHTHGCPCGPCESAAEGPCHTEPVDDLVADTLPDVACWTRQDMSFHSFGTDYESLDSEQIAQIEDTFLNVMSYHPADPERTRLTAEQVLAMMDGVSLRSPSIVGFLEDAPCEQQDFGDREVVAGYFVRGDANSDGSVQVGDPVRTLNFLFGGAPEPPCQDAADTNDDGLLNTSDAIFTLSALFAGGNAVPRPGLDACGPDPTPDELPECAADPGACPARPAD